MFNKIFKHSCREGLTSPVATLHNTVLPDEFIRGIYYTINVHLQYNIQYNIDSRIPFAKYYEIYQIQSDLATDDSHDPITRKYFNRSR